MPPTVELAALALPADDPAHQEVIMNRIHRWLADHGR
jgi:hypothetical protein